jgi:hypothetical protein
LRSNFGMTNVKIQISKQAPNWKFKIPNMGFVLTFEDVT